MIEDPPNLLINVHLTNFVMDRVSFLFTIDNCSSSSDEERFPNPRMGLSLIRILNLDPDTRFRYSSI